MTHQPIKRLVPSAERAILFVHGIAGTPHYFSDFVERIPDSVSVYNMLLDGHGKGVQDFAHTSMRIWETQVRLAVEELSSTHQSIDIVAHSMGTLFAIEQAIRHPKIKKLFLLAVPIKLFLKPQTLLDALKVSSREEQEDTTRYYGIESDPNLLHYVGWLPRYAELLGKIGQTKRSIEFLRTPCRIFQSARDEMVAKSSVKVLRRSPTACVMELKHSSHYQYHPKDYELLMKSFEQWFLA